MNLPTFQQSPREFIMAHHTELAKVFLTKAIQEPDPVMKQKYMEIHKIRLARADLAKHSKKHSELVQMARTVMAERALMPEAMP